MPCVNLHIIRAASRAQKARIVIQAIAAADCGHAGLLTDNWNQRQA